MFLDTRRKDHIFHLHLLTNCSVITQDLQVLVPYRSGVCFLAAFIPGIPMDHYVKRLTNFYYLPASMIGWEMVGLWFRNRAVWGLESCQGFGVMPVCGLESFDEASQDINWWATSNTWNLELFIQHVSITKQHSMQNRFLFIQRVFLWIQPYNLLFFSLKIFCHLLPRHTSSWPPARPIFFVSETKKQVMGWDGAVCFWGEGMYRFWFFLQLEPPKKRDVFFVEFDYVIASMIFVDLHSLPMRNSRFDASLLHFGVKHH